MSIWDNFLDSLLSIQSQQCRQKDYCGFFFKAFRSGIKFHTDPRLFLPIFEQTVPEQKNYTLYEMFEQKVHLFSLW